MNPNKNVELAEAENQEFVVLNESLALENEGSMKEANSGALQVC